MFFVIFDVREGVFFVAEGKGEKQLKRPFFARLVGFEKNGVFPRSFKINLRIREF